MTKEQLKWKLKDMIASRAGKCYAVLTAAEVKTHTDQILKELKSIKQIQSTFPNFGGKQNDLRY